MVLTGDFSSVSALDRITIQTAANTNNYYPKASGYIQPKALYAGTTNGVTVSLTFGYTNNDVVYIIGGDAPSRWPIFMADEINTHRLHANYDHTNNAVVYSNGLSTTLSNSLYLTNQPAWFDQTFPPFGPSATYGKLPAEVRFNSGL